MIDNDFISDLKEKLYNAVARQYILDMKAGQKPDERPEMIGEFWEEIVSDLERQYVKFQGNMERIIEARCIEFPALADLLKVSSPVQGVGVGVPELPEEARLPAELSMGACPWLDMYIAHSKKASPEAYKLYHPFAGLWVLSAVANRRIYLPLAEKRLYANLMIQFCGKPNYFAKSHTARVGERLLARAGLDFLVIADKRMTPQKLLEEMTGITSVDEKYFSLFDEDQKEANRIRAAFAGQRAPYYDEFGKMLKEILAGKDQNVAVYGSIFLSLYDNPFTYSNGTVWKGMPLIQLPFLTILGAMTPANMRTIARGGAESWQDGLFSRNVFLVPSDEDIVHETLKFQKIDSPFELVQALRSWHNRLGSPMIDITQGDKDRPIITPLSPHPQHEMIIDDNVWQAFDRYRIAVRKLGCSKLVPDDLEANYGRLPEQALKFSMLMASIENHNHIALRHWARAQELAELLRHDLHKLYAQVNTDFQPTKEATIEQCIIECLQKKPEGMTLSALHHDYLKRKYSIKQIEDALKGMKRHKIVEAYRTSQSEKYKLINNTDDE